MSNLRDDELRHICEEFYLAAKAVHGDLGLSFDGFFILLLSTARRHTGQPAAFEAPIDLINSLHKEDLYLSFACAQGGEAAWQRFDLSYRKYMRDIARSVCMTRDESNDLASAVLADLFLPARSGQSLIAGYDGQAALATWLRVIITRRALNERALKWSGVEHPECMAEIADANALTMMDKSLRANKYRCAITASIRCASLSLSERERLILLMRYEDSMRMNDIARFFGLHPSTITRQLQQAHKKLQNEILGALTTEYDSSEGALEECLDDLQENPLHSILAAIKSI